jgi:hypothetical protein
MHDKARNIAGKNTRAGNMPAKRVSEDETDEAGEENEKNEEGETKDRFLND